VFGDIPIAEQRDALECGVKVVDVRNGKVVGGLQFHSGVDALFDVKLLIGVHCPVLSGPLPENDGARPIWMVQNPQDGPTPGEAEQHDWG
jgi:hypothetical protein